MSIEVAISFGGLGPERLAVAETATRLVPSLAGDALARCAVGFRTQARSLLLRASLAGGATGEAAAARLAFWVARAGGVACRLERAEAARDVERALAASELLAGDVAPEELWSALERGFAALRGGALPPLEIAVPTLRLRLAEGGLRYDPEARLLFVPGALAPPPGDDLRVAVEGRAGLPACGAVRAVEAPPPPGAGGPGFVVAVSRRADALHAALAGHALAAPPALDEPARRLRVAR